jgi:cell wall-associated NlpC family hydrolase
VLSSSRRPPRPAIAATVLATALMVLSATGASAAGGHRAARHALRQVGDDYRYGGSGPRGFDCSGLTRASWRNAPVLLPRTSRAQRRRTRHVPRRRLRRGDLLFFYRPVSHVGLYLGRGRMVHASSSDDAVERTRVYWRSFVGGGRPR